MPQAKEGQQYYVNDELFPTMVCLRAKWPDVIWLCSTVHFKEESNCHLDVFSKKKQDIKNHTVHDIYKQLLV